jgi:type I restriction enzyme S subunit
MVPSGWNVVEAGEVCERISVGIVVKPKDYYVPEEEGVRAFRSANVREGFVEDSNWTYISEIGNQKNKKSILKTGDVLIVRTGYPGTACVVPQQYSGSNCIDIIFARPNQSLVLPEFLCEFTNSEYGKKQVLDGQGGLAQQHFNVGAYNKLKVPLPPLPEQRKIAEILTTWDSAIETAQALLATARGQKRALMQSLLTGKRRFPEFEGQEWREVRLGDVTTLIVSNVDKKTKDGEAAVRLCNYTDVYKRDTIHSSQDFMEATATKAQIKKFGLKAGDVVITKDSETAEDIAMPSYVAETADDLVCGYHLAIVRPGPQVDGRFLKFYFDLPHTRYYFGTRANGAIRFGLTIDGIEGARVRTHSQ